MTILSRLNAFLLLVVIATCIAGFFVSRYANNWRYAHREEEERYYQKKSYIRSTAESVEIAKDIRIFNRNTYYDLFSAVFQEFSIWDVTVAEEIAQTTEGIDDTKVRDCIEKAGLTDAIEKLPQGLDTHIGREVYLDGVLFSGGQTQRLMLARALYKDGPILFLDEPTAALDPIAENDIYLKYGEMTRGKTSLFISHRLASTRFCDRILFLSDGAIKEEGTHEELLARGGAYAKLFEVQSRYYQEGKEF